MDRNKNLLIAMVGLIALAISLCLPRPLLYSWTDVLKTWCDTLFTLAFLWFCYLSINLIGERITDRIPEEDD